MEGDVCMNRACKEGPAILWKKGWPLLSGGFARLCIKCGTAYEKSVFCHKFHAHESGWRKCNYCGKLVHCGCIVSRSSFEYIDLGGVGCVTCLKASQSFLMHNNEAPNESVRSTKNNASDRDAEHIDSAGEGKLMQLCKIAEASESKSWPQAQKDATVSCIGPNNQKAKSLFREEDTRLSNVMKQSSHSFTFTTAENNRPTWETKSMQELLSLSDSPRTSSGNCALPSATEIVEGRLEVKESSPFPQGKSSYPPILPKPLKSGHIINLETNKDMSSQARIARPPAEGKGKNQLLSRYWPRITDQELEQLSGDLKSTVVPLFEKVLSISDASRIGRLVLPKACAEAYFPPISQSEGIPLHIQDVKGNEWTFQFRFWPNNNSRMYVLEGVTPCIQSMQLNAGDTVTFSRIDPGGKYVMGVRRRTSNFVYAQVASASAHSNDISTKETTFSGAAENLYSESSFVDLLQSRKGSEEPYLDGNSEHLHLGTQIADGLQTENGEEKMNNDTLQQLISVSEKKRTHKIGPKTKRLDIYNEDSANLRLAWDKMDLLCPPPGVKPSIEIIDGVEIEEYNEPPVFREETTVNVSPSESSIPASEQPSTKESENLQRANKDSKKEKFKSNQQQKPSGLDALADAVILEDNLVDPVGVTTKHPRHRPGCTCIVCVQPPSGKARHKPSCTCLACLSMKRRFNTLRLRKKNHQSKHEVDAAHIHHSDEPDSKGASGEDTSQLEKEGRPKRGQVEVAEPSARQIDLNCHPSHEDMQVD